MSDIIVHPLVVLPSPRAIPSVKAAINTLPCDKLWIKYVGPELKAYQCFRNYFLKHKEYTHMVICPDDLVVNKEEFDILMDDVRRHNYPVISGLCNIDAQPEHKGYLNACIHTMPRPYEWIHESLADVLALFEEPAIRVQFMGFPFVFISRPVVEAIEFSGDAHGCCVDLAFCISCANRRIPLYVDPRVRPHHLKIKEASAVEGGYYCFPAGCYAHVIVEKMLPNGGVDVSEHGLDICEPDS